jgi:hypothetical protein
MHEGKTFHQYTGRWTTKPRYSVSSRAIRPAIAEAARYPRLAFRDIARSNDERTMIAFLAPPGTVFGHTATVEKAPWAREPADALLLCALFNSFTFDWLIRQKAATHLSLYLLDGLPISAACWPMPPAACPMRPIRICAPASMPSSPAPMGWTARASPMSWPASRIDRTPVRRRSAWRNFRANGILSWLVNGSLAPGMLR